MNILSFLSAHPVYVYNKNILINSNKIINIIHNNKSKKVIMLFRGLNILKLQNLSCDFKDFM